LSCNFFLENIIGGIALTQRLSNSDMALTTTMCILRNSAILVTGNFTANIFYTV